MQVPFLHMFWYLILFNYDGAWHISPVSRETQYDSTNETDQLWFLEAARSSVNNLGILKHSCHTLKEVELFPLHLTTTQGDSAQISLQSAPIDSKDIIHLMI